MTEDREREEEQPRVRITDRRRFADLREGDGAPADAAGATPAPDAGDAAPGAGGPGSEDPSELAAAQSTEPAVNRAIASR